MILDHPKTSGTTSLKYPAITENYVHTSGISTQFQTSQLLWEDGVRFVITERNVYCYVRFRCRELVDGRHFWIVQTLSITLFTLEHERMVKAYPLVKLMSIRLLQTL